MDSLLACLTPWADTGLRVVAGLFLMPHGMQKLFGVMGADPAGEAGLFALHGFVPAAFWVKVVGIVQFAGGALLALGLFTRPVAALLAVMLLVTLRVTARAGWFWHRGGAEYSLLWAAVCAFFALHGAGRYALDRLL